MDVMEYWVYRNIVEILNVQNFHNIIVDALPLKPEIFVVAMETGKWWS